MTRMKYKYALDRSQSERTGNIASNVPGGRHQSYATRHAQSLFSSSFSSPFFRFSSGFDFTGAFSCDQSAIEIFTLHRHNFAGAFVIHDTPYSPNTLQCIPASIMFNISSWSIDFDAVAAIQIALGFWTLLGFSCHRLPQDAFLISQLFDVFLVLISVTSMSLSIQCKY
jgi:hypothetical protein